MGWFFKGLPSGKRVTPIYPMETPNGAANTVGGRFIPSGLLLAQDFTHEPACQTGERAPQGRFRHQPEQMVHPPFAWQLASFPSLPVCGVGGPVLFLTELRHPTDIFLENQGTASPFCLLVSVPGTGCTCGFAGARLPGDFPARPWLAGFHTLRERDPRQRGSR